MNLREIKEILELMDRHELTEFEFEKNGVKVKLSKSPTGQVTVTPQAFSGARRQHVLDRGYRDRDAVRQPTPLWHAARRRTMAEARPIHRRSALTAVLQEADRRGSRAASVGGVSVTAYV